MIISFKNKHLENFYDNDVTGKKIPSGIEDSLFEALQMIDAAVNVQDLRSPPDNRLKLLKGHLEGQYAIRVNNKYRLIFTWNDALEGAENVYLDPHSYK